MMSISVYWQLNLPVKFSELHVVWNTWNTGKVIGSSCVGADPEIFHWGESWVGCYMYFTILSYGGRLASIDRPITIVSWSVQMSKQKGVASYPSTPPPPPDQPLLSVALGFITRNTSTRGKVIGLSVEPYLLMHNSHIIIVGYDQIVQLA